MINIGNLTIKNLYINNLEVKEAWLGNVKVYPNESSEFKFRLTYSDGSVYEKECETDETITRDEIDNFENITDVVIGDCVSRIGVGAFSNCTGLTSVTVNATTPPTLGSDAFDNTNNCPIYVPNASVNAYKADWSDYTSRIEPMSQEYEGFCKLTLNGGSVVELEGSGELTEAIVRPDISIISAEIGTLCTSIGNRAFYECSALSSVTIPNSVTSISERAFDGCRSLTSVIIPSSVTSIGNRAFNYCDSLTSVTIGSSVTSIGVGAFASCYKLTSVTIPNGVTSISDYAFQSCSRLTSVTIPNSVTDISFRAFEGCSSLTSVIIPSSVTSIGGGAFYYCSGLTSVTVNATTPPTLGSDTFDVTNDCPIYVPNASVDAYKTAWSKYASRIQAIA